MADVENTDAASVQDPPIAASTDVDASSNDTPPSEEVEMNRIIEDIRSLCARDDPLFTKKIVQGIMIPLLEMEMDAIIKDIRSMYASGVPLFTKKKIREVMFQLDEISQINAEDDMFLVTGIDDTKVAVIPVTENPMVDNWEWKWHEQTLTRSNRALVIYQPIQKLTDFSSGTRYFDARTAYLSLAACRRYNYVSSGVEDDAATCKFSVAKLEREFNDKKKEWEATHECNTLQTLVALNPGFSKAQKVIGIALGGLMYGERVEDRRTERSLAQYSLLLTMRELIAKATGSDEIRCLAQDPELTPAAVEALANVGIAVVDDPDAFLELDDTSVLITMSPSIPVRQVVADIARPVAIFWDEDPEDASAVEELMGDPPSTRVNSMIQNEYIKLELPQYKLFAPAVLYLRKM